MEDQNKTKEQLIEELVILRKRLAEYESNINKTKTFSCNDNLLYFAKEGLLLFSDNIPLDNEEIDFDLFNNSPNPVLVINPDSSIIFANSALQEVTGFTFDNIAFQKIPYPWFIQGMSYACSKDFDSTIEIAPKKFEEIYQNKDGKNFWVENTITPIISNNKVRCYISSWIDITERKRAEEALANEKEWLAVTLRSIVDGVIAIDTNYNVILINKAAETLTGWNSEDAVGRKLSEIFYITNNNEHEFCEEKLLKTDNLLFNDITLIDKNGSKRIVSANSNLISDSNANVIGAVLVFCDVTEKRRMEEEILKIQRLESLGTLAGGIAHDFNNILTAILGNISLARIYKDMDKIQERLLEAEKSALKARDLTKQLHTFSKGGAPIKKTAQISDFIKDSVIFASKGSKIKFEFDIADDLWAVDIDEGMMNQVINSLIINAIRTMPDGGIVKVCGQNVDIKANSGLPLKESKYVKISIEDNGQGIPKEYLNRIFDPYFSIKNQGGNLGLAAAYSIVRGHDGHITVDSVEGYGTTFSIYLPAFPETFVTRKVRKTDKPIMGKGKVLLMDDEKYIRDIASEMLNNIGYKVVTTIDGNEALLMYEEARKMGQPYDAVILDLVVPGGMGGKEAIQKLIQIDPSVKAIVSSAYSNDPIMADWQKYGFKGVIAKPYKITELSEVLYNVLNED